MNILKEIDELTRAEVSQQAYAVRIFGKEQVI